MPNRAREGMTLLLKGHLFSWSGDSFTVKDLDGNVWSRRALVLTV